MKKICTPEMRRLSVLLRMAGFSKKHPLVLDGKPTISVYVGTYKYVYRYPFRVTSVYPKGNSVTFSGEHQTYSGETLSDKWEKTSLPETICNTEYTSKDLELHWSQAPEYNTWKIDALLKTVLAELPRKTKKPIVGDYYSVESDEKGNKFIHIHGYFETGPDKPYLTELTWLREPLKNFVKEFDRNGQDYIDEWYEWVTQYQTDYENEKEAMKAMNSFFGGKPADRILSFKELKRSTPVGSYINIP